MMVWCVWCLAEVFSLRRGDVYAITCRNSRSFERPTRCASDAAAINERYKLLVLPCIVIEDLGGTQKRPEMKYDCLFLGIM